MTINYISMFSGGGGLDLGLEATGVMKSAACIELEKNYFNTLRLNQGRSFGHHSFLESAKLFNSDVISDEVLSYLKTKKIHEGNWAFVGGPPCQSFSTIGKMEILDDPRGNMTIKFFELIAEFMPRFFLFENVPPVGQAPGHAMRAQIQKLLDSAGYHYCSRIVNFADYGCFTKRNRFIIIGDLTKKIDFPEAPFSEFGGLFTDPWRASKDAIGQVPDPYSKNELTHHEPVFHTDEVAKRFRNLKLGEYDRKRHRSKLNPDCPAPTLVAGGNSGYVHHIHWDSRELTSRESACIHGFPENYEFAGTKLDVAKQIVNSIPIQFGSFIADFLARRI